MAAIDKIYLNSYEEYTQFKGWCDEQPLIYDKYGKGARLTDYMYEYDETEWKDGSPVFNAPYYVDAYVIRNCPIEGVQKELMINYGHWSQERIKDFYNDVINWDENNGECPYWAKKEDFITLEDGTMTINGLEKSSYEMIKDGELYTNPRRGDYEYGKHFRCTKHPVYFYNRPYKYRSWWVNVILPHDYRGHMWYHSNHNTWDFSDEFVICGWTSNTANVKTIKSLKRLMLKWKFPIGTKVMATGRYVADNYEFVITK